MRCRSHPGLVSLALIACACSTVLGIDGDFEVVSGSGAAGIGATAGQAAAGGGGAAAVGGTAGSAGSSGSAGVGAAGTDGGVGGSAGSSGSAGESGASGTGGVAGSAGATAGSPVKLVQSGSVTLPANVALATATVQPVDASKSILMFGTRFNSVTPAATHVSGRIVDAQTLSFERSSASNAPLLPVHWYLAEFKAGVSVTRGSTPIAASFVNVILPQSVDLTKSFPIISFRNTGTSYANDDFVRAKLIDPTTLSLNTNLSAPNGVVEWQIVTFDESIVQYGDTAISGNATTAAATIQAVDPTRTWLLFTYYCTNISSSNIGQNMIRGWVDSSTQLSFERTNSGSSCNLSWYAVEITNGTKIEAGLTSFAAQETSKSTILPTAITLSKSLVSAGALYYRGGTTEYSQAGNPGVATVTLDLMSQNQLVLSRAFACPTCGADIGWSVVEFY